MFAILGLKPVISGLVWPGRHSPRPVGGMTSILRRFSPLRLNIFSFFDILPKHQGQLSLAYRVLGR